MGVKMIRVLVMIFGGLFLLAGLVPAAGGYLNSGVAALMIFGVLTAVAAGLWRFSAAKWWKAVRCVLAGCLLVCFCTGLVISCFMLKYGYFNRPRGNETGTLVVLGCQIHGEEPSLMLSYRLDAAAAYLREHETAPVVVAGGTGAGETVSEAYVMKKYLIANGIAEERIYTEDRSASTEENIRFSWALIRENNLPEDLIIVSDGFHLFRAHLFAEKMDASCRGIPAKTYFPLLPAYWVREILGVLHLFLL